MRGGGRFCSDAAAAAAALILMINRREDDKKAYCYHFFHPLRDRADWTLKLEQVVEADVSWYRMIDTVVKNSQLLSHLND